jgi:hypothetical protein
MSLSSSILGLSTSITRHSLHFIARWGSRHSGLRRIRHNFLSFRPIGDPRTRLRPHRLRRKESRINKDPASNGCGQIFSDYFSCSAISHCGEPWLYRHGCINETCKTVCACAGHIPAKWAPTSRMARRKIHERPITKITGPRAERSGPANSHELTLTLLRHYAVTPLSLRLHQSTAPRGAP